MAACATVAILLYHSIAPSSTRSFAKLTVDPVLLDEHLAALAQHSVPVMTVAEVPAALADGRSGVAISIDDGLVDVAEHAAASFARHGLRGTLFVPSAYVEGCAEWLRGADRQRRLLSWRELSDLAQAGFEIGSHGRLHLAADVNPPALISADATASRRELEERLGCAVASYAYPFGYHSSAARAAVRAAGFAQACCVEELPACADDDRWALPRIQVGPRTSPEALIEIARWRPSAARRGWAHAKQGLWAAGRRRGLVGPPEAARRARR